MRIRHLGRLRWITKARVAKRYEVRGLTAARFVLLDPEDDSFTYGVSNWSAIAAAIAPALGSTPTDVLAAIAEMDTDAGLREALRQPRRHWLWSKRDPQPKGYHLICWAAIRTLRPTCVVETGILDGMASIVMLRALERNRGDGHEGELFSFDVMPGAGAMVPEQLRDRWHPVYESSVEAIAGTVGDRRIGFLALDSLCDPDYIRAELDAVIPHRDETLVAVSTWGTLDVLGWTGAEVTRVQEQPRDHFYSGITYAIARI